MFNPPSLADAVKARAFHAQSGELGLHLGDARSFLDACRHDGIEVLGWELWVIDHVWGTVENGPVPAPGLWCGLIPFRGELAPAIVGGEGDADATQNQLAAIDLNVQVEPIWIFYVRVNFTLAD
ncbi:hypothetical protein [Iodidimonas sp. SYSU 1G8]|uniref:hypothetical protein n=1 Tax=Iodidimonas sp. SYSU 1G8 TaxID=3133967 RepID=UPI0031FEE019